MQQFDSIKFYTLLQQAESFIKDNVSDGRECRLFIFGAYNDKDGPKICLSRGYGNEELKITGRHLGEMVEEFNRQRGFAERQQNLQIGAVVVEHEVEKIVPAPMRASTEDDEVPF